MIQRLLAFALIMGFAGISAGSAEPPSGQQLPDQTKTNHDNYEKFYREAFRKDAIDKCVASAPKAAAAGFDVSPTCACVTDDFLASKNLDQLIEMQPDNLPKQELAAVTADCLKRSPPIQKSKGKLRSKKDNVGSVSD